MSAGKPLLAFAVFVVLGVVGMLRSVPAQSPELDPDEQVLRAANIGTDEPGLLKYLEKRQPRKSTPEDVKRLIEQLGSQEFEARERASEQLRRMGRVVFPQLRQETMNRDPEVARRAQRCIELIESDRTGDLAIAALRLLDRRLGARATPALIEALGDVDETVQRYAGEALLRLGNEDRRVVAVLASAVTHQNSQVRTQTIEVLGQFGGKASGATPSLCEALKDPVLSVRRAAARMLGVIQPNPETAVPALIAALEDKDRTPDNHEMSVPEAAAGSLGNLGPRAKAGLPALLRASASKDVKLRFQAILALGTIDRDGNSVIPTLLGTLKEQDEQCLRRAAAWALGEIGPRAKEGIPFLLTALKCEDVRDSETSQLIQCAVLEALGKMGAEAKEAIPSILKRVRDKSTEGSVRAAAIQALTGIGVNSPTVVSVLTELLKDEDLLVAQTAGKALKRLQEKK
jgi:HEAT repeat protein